MSEPAILTDRSEGLFRQVHPNHINPEDGSVRSSCYMDDEISHARARFVTESTAYEQWVAVPGRLSEGTWAVTVGDASDAGCAAYDDSNQDDVPAGHAFIENRGGRAEKKRRARLLAAAATTRGRLHP